MLLCNVIFGMCTATLVYLELKNKFIIKVVQMYMLISALRLVFQPRSVKSYVDSTITFVAQL